MNNYCPDLFENLFVQKNNDNKIQVGFCCISGLSEPSEQIDFSNKHLEQQRNYFIENQQLPHGCFHCISDEKNNSTSRRLQQLSYWPNHNYNVQPNLKRLQYNCDNICNLKCIQCDSFSSSSWIDDEKLLGIKNKRLKIQYTKHNQLLYQFDVKGIQEIYFNGGEPLFTKDHINVLSYISSNTNAKDIHVVYNTNATLLPSQEVLEVWNKFRSIQLVASIDAINDQFEYIRYPGVWSNVYAMLLEYKKYANVSIGCNIGLHNVLYYDDLYKFCLDNAIPFNFQCETRGWLSLKNLPLHIKDAVYSKLKEAIDSDTKTYLLNILENSHQPDLTWIPYLHNLDKIRNTDWRRSLSKLYKLDSNFFDNYDKNFSYPN